MISPKLFQKKLLDWYLQNGRKNLPWQKDVNAYPVWLSEIMLQQTQVITVIPYFKKFLQKFPTIVDLAKASLDEVLKLWAGLGYYSRARNLYKTAQIVVRDYQGIFPADLAILQKFPGIGRSTAGAILSFAYRKRAPILDGNVKRVLVRLHAIKTWAGNIKTLKKLWELSDQYTPEKHIEKYTQAFMDFGSLVCTRTKPKCHQCPFQLNCCAFLTHIQNDLPVKKPRKRAPLKKTFMLILKNENNEILFLKRPPIGIWGGLWSFPETDQNDFDSYCKKEFHCQIVGVQELKSFIHKFSHFHLEITPVLIHIKYLLNQVMETPNIVWHDVKQELTFGIPKPVQMIFNTIAIDDKK